MSYDKHPDDNIRPLTYEEIQEMKRRAFYEHEKTEYDESGKRLSRKPNTGLRIGSYRFKSSKK